MMPNSSKAFVKHQGLELNNMKAKLSSLSLHFSPRSLPTLLLATLMLSACGDGELGGDGQSQDPAVVDFPIAFVQRSLPADEDGLLENQDPREPFSFNPGATLFLKERAALSAQKIDISSASFPGNALYDVKDISINDDGDKIIFAMRAPEIEDADDDEQPTWNIWQYDNTTQVASRIIESNILAAEGQDIAPQYLPDGRIVFSSTRQRSSKAILIDEGKTQFAALDEDLNEPAAVLHVMDSDGTDIHQITFNQNHDLNAVVLRNGRILFSRWDNAGNTNGFDLYQVDPDGQNLNFVYGKHSHDIEIGDENETLQFTRPSEMPSGEVVLLPQRYNAQSVGTDLLLIDVENFTETNQPIGSASASLISTQSSLAFGAVNLSDGPSLGGRFSSVFPLWDSSDRLLVSWSDCRLTNTATDDQGEPLPQQASDPVLFCNEENLANASLQESNPLFGLWMYDPNSNTQLPLELPPEGQGITDAVVLGPKPNATFLADSTVDQSLADRNLGVLNIRSVYDFDGVDMSPAGIDVLADPEQTPVDQRPARFLRVLKAVSQASDDVVEVNGSAFGFAGRQRMKEILGYAPIEPDGSVRVTIPANIAFTLSVLDVDGKRLNASQRHQNWLQLRPGEELQCNGCHTNNSEQPHGRPDAAIESVNFGAPTSTLPFPNTNPALFADIGDTMAETRSIRNGTPSLDVNLTFVDIWNDPALSTPADSFELSYTDLSTAVPVATSCVTEWTGLCRIVINYPEHIQPLWDLQRETLVVDERENTTCVSCHNIIDAAGDSQVPAAQLDLTGGPSDQENQRSISFQELLNNDQEVFLDNGVLRIVLVQDTDDEGNLLFNVDELGELILDEDNNPTPILVPIGNNIVPPLARSDASSNSDFFDLFAEGGSHANYLTAIELKLITEWLDIGIQYYNDPFAISQD